MSDPNRPRVLEEEARRAAVDPAERPRVIETDDVRPIELGPVAMSAGELVVLPPAAPQASRGLKALAISGIGLAGMAGVSSLWWVAALFDRGWGFGLAGAAFLALAVGGAGALIGHELRALRRLRRVAEVHDHFREAPRSDGEMRAQLDRVAVELAASARLAPGVAAWRAKAGRDLPAADARRVFEGYVLAEADRQAVAAIRRAARDTFGLVAISPRAAVDIAAFTWRATKLAREVGEAYGYRPAKASTVALIRRALGDIGMITGTDMAGDALVSLLGGSVVEKVSAAASEGAVAAWRMARFGLLLVDSARPVPFAEDKRPKIADLLRP